MGKLIDVQELLSAMEEEVDKKNEIVANQIKYAGLTSTSNIMSNMVSGMEGMIRFVRDYSTRRIPMGGEND